MAALDGIQNKLSPGEPLDQNIYELPTTDSSPALTPGYLDEALTALERDHDFLTRNDVFNPKIIQTWIAHKRQNETSELRLRPHPYEFCMYFDA